MSPEGATDRPEFIYHVATSLDGFIARPDGGIDWLEDVSDAGDTAAGDSAKSDYGLTAFYDSIDSLVMGRASYDFAASFGAWPYTERPSYVFTNRPIPNPPAEVVVVSGDVAEVARRMAAAGLKRAWLIGGGNLAAAFLHAGQIDEIVVSIHAVLLGEGVRMVHPPHPQLDLVHVGTESYPSGLVQISYARRRRSRRPPTRLQI